MHSPIEEIRKVSKANYIKLAHVHSFIHGIARHIGAYRYVINVIIYPNLPSTLSLKLARFNLSLLSPFSVAVQSFSLNQPNLHPGKACL
jgi:hypothetical protein